MTGPEILTFGCRLNIADSAAMRALLPHEDGLVIVNSCAVTEAAVRQSAQAVRRARRTRPDARIVVTGCAAQIEPARFAAMPQVDRVIGAAEKHHRANFRFPDPATAPDVRVGDIAALRQTVPTAVPTFSTHARAFVEIQTGCDHHCTFCVIPQGRGRNRSVPAGMIADRVAALVAAGHREIVLTGVDIASYGADLPGAGALAGLVTALLHQVPALGRLRLSTLDPAAIDAPLVELLTMEPRIMPHVHLSMQSGNDLILKRMRRRHLRADIIGVVDRLRSRRPDIAVGADLIAGFPTEDAAAAADSLSLIAECDIGFAHVFPFSPRTGTPAARMPQVDPHVARARAATLRAAAADRHAGWLARLVGTTQSVLVERDGRHGHAAGFARVGLVDAPDGLAGRIVTARVVGVDGDRLTAHHIGTEA